MGHGFDDMVDLHGQGDVSGKCQDRYPNIPITRIDLYDFFLGEFYFGS